MDIDGYDGSQLAPLETNMELNDNSLTANVDQMFDITNVENTNNMGNQLEDNSTLNEGNNEYIENMNNKPEVKIPESKKVEEANKGFLQSLGIIVIFVIIWVIIGLIAFITSLVCFGFSGSTTEKIFGLILALLFGPFYFLYFYLNKNYCGKKTNIVKSD
jgi:hypothetical protein